MWGGKPSAEHLAALVKAEVLERENERLREQVTKLQDALVAATSPLAYERLIAEQARKQGPDPVNEELLRETQAVQRYIAELEDPSGIFRSPDEFISYFSSGMRPDLLKGLEEVVTTAPEPAGSLHGNPES